MLAWTIQFTTAMAAELQSSEIDLRHLDQVAVVVEGWHPARPPGSGASHLL